MIGSYYILQTLSPYLEDKDLYILGMTNKEINETIKKLWRWKIAYEKSNIHLCLISLSDYYYLYKPEAKHLYLTNKLNNTFAFEKKNRDGLCKKLDLLENRMVGSLQPCTSICSVAFLILAVFLPKGFLC